MLIGTEFEFRYRFWFIFGIFWVAFLLYFLDPVNTAAWLVDRIAPHASPARTRALLHALFGVGALLAVGAALLRSWATAYLKSEVVHDTRLHSEGLVADGPYRYLRHPLYFGNVVLMLGMTPLTSRLGALFLLVVGTLYHLRLAGREEVELEKAQGERYARYRAAVPGMFPSLVPRVPAGGGTPAWPQGFAGETFQWMIALAMVALAITLRGRVLFVVIPFGVAAYWLLFALWKRRAARAA
jgi:protein-S-isoprenylcysteine O-methyltransferase Ste14